MNQTLRFRNFRQLIAPLFMLLLSFSFSQLTAQNGELVNSNLCGQDAVIQTFIQGVQGPTANRINIPVIDGFSRGYAEVWLTTNECPSGLPNTIELTSNGGQTLTATGTDITDPGGNERERIYRATFTQALTSVTVADLNGCSDVVSMTLSVESFLENSASFLVQFDRELDGPSANGDDCLGFSLNVGSELNDREFVISIPIHEKDNGTDRFVEFSVSSGGNTVSDRRADQTNGPEASLYTATIVVPANEDRIFFEICSPDQDGDSFGIGAVVVSSEQCSIPCPSDFDPGSIDGGLVNCGSYTPSTNLPTNRSVPASNLSLIHI